MPRPSPGAAAAWTAAVLAIFAAWTVYSYGQHFLLIEYRFQILHPFFFNPLDIFAPSRLFDDTAMSVAFSRSFFLLTNSALGTYCGHWLLCHNLFHIALLVSAAGLMAATLWRLFPAAPALLFAATMVFFLFSVPIFDAVSWQATILDKLSLFFTAACLLLVSRIELTDRRATSLLASNLLLLVLVAMACNSKEAAFSLAPSMLLLLMMRLLAAAPRLNLRSGVEALWGSLGWLALPIAYCVFHVTVVLIHRTMINVGERARVFGGSASDNLPLFIRFLLNLDLDNAFTRKGWTTVAIGGCAILAAVAVAMVARGRSRLQVLTFVWALVCFGLAIAIPLRTTAASPFYLLVPLYYLAILFFVAFLVIWNAVPHKVARFAMPLVIASVLVIHVKGLVNSYTLYDRLSAISTNFVPALHSVAEAVARGPAPTRIRFLWPASEQRAYMFLGTPTDRNLAAFLLPPETPGNVVAAMDNRIVDQSYNTLGEAQVAPRSGELVVVLGEKLRLEAIVPPPR